MATTVQKTIKKTKPVSYSFMYQVNKHLREKRNAKAMKIRMAIDFTLMILLGVLLAWLPRVLW